MAESAFTDYYKKTPKERLEILKNACGLTEEEAKAIATNALPIETANRMIENVVGFHPLPLGIATNFRINEKEYLVPMAIEEPSVVAAASFAAKLCRPTGFLAAATEPIMIGQVQLVNVPNPKKAIATLEEQKQKIIEYANTIDPMVMVKYGGGLKDMEFRMVESQRGTFIVIHLLVDVRDAMGANAINTLAETLATRFEELTAGKVRLRIISNLAVHRMATSTAVWSQHALEESTKGQFSGEEVVERILDAWAFAETDPFRCATHNKGIMNGIDAATIATGNDWRAVESGAHAFAAMNFWGHPFPIRSAMTPTSLVDKIVAEKKQAYKPLTRFFKDKKGDLMGEIKLPLAVATIGGATATHPSAAIARKILNVSGAQELSCVLASVGLAQNFAALRALATEGIQKGHMRLHSRNIAVMAGARSEEIDIVAQKIADENKVRVDRAKEVLEELRKKNQ